MHGKTPSIQKCRKMEKKIYIFEESTKRFHRYRTRSFILLYSMLQEKKIEEKEAKKLVNKMKKKNEKLAHKFQTLFSLIACTQIIEAEMQFVYISSTVKICAFFSQLLHLLSSPFYTTPLIHPLATAIICQFFFIFLFYFSNIFKEHTSNSSEAHTKKNTAY